MNDLLAQAIGPLFGYVAGVQEHIHRGEHPELEAVKSDLVALLTEAEQKANVSREVAADYAMARHALVYWIDEVLIHSKWSHADEWRYHFLEWDYYRENLAGDKFYDKAEEAERLNGTDALEVYFLCVALGFQGKYVYSKSDLHTWAQRVYARIAAAAPPLDRFLPDDPGDASRGALRALPGKTVLLLVSILTSTTLIVSVLAWIAVNHFKPVS